MKFVFLLALTACCLFATALPDAEIEKEWLNFSLRYGKKYRSMDDTNNRFQKFKDNLKRINRHNKLFEQQLVSYRMAINPFADKDLKEMESSFMGLKISEEEKRRFFNKSHLRASTSKNPNFPTFVDWRASGAVTAVKNQLACGSCWAFSSTGALEAHHFLKHNESILLSEQNLVDCVKENFGCEGGWMIPSFEYIQVNSGINPETKYPYEAVDGQCRFQSEYVAAKCNGYQTIRQGDEQHLLEIVAVKGPVAVAIAVNSNFMKYVEGIYDDGECTQMVNHAVLVVGYGIEGGKDYWLVKNSWGTEWGEKGYIKMARNKQNQCAIATYASYPLS